MTYVIKFVIFLTSLHANKIRRRVYSIGCWYLIPWKCQSCNIQICIFSILLWNLRAITFSKKKHLRANLCMVFFFCTCKNWGSGEKTKRVVNMHCRSTAIVSIFTKLIALLSRVTFKKNVFGNVNYLWFLKCILQIFCFLFFDERILVHQNWVIQHITKMQPCCKQSQQHS